jgi:hypothetical protein
MGFSMKENQPQGCTKAHEERVKMKYSHKTFESANQRFVVVKDSSNFGSFAVFESKRRCPPLPQINGKTGL